MSAADASPSSSAEDRTAEAAPAGAFAELASSLVAQRRAIGLEVVVLHSVDSTNRLGRRLVERVGAELGDLLLVAWRQSAGRGRVGRSWASPGGLGTYQSLVLRVERLGGVSRDRIGLAPLRVGVALCSALRSDVPEIALKWPNDLITPQGKLGGILIELVGSGEAATVVVGYGINVGHTESQRPLPSATSIRLESDGRVPVLGELVSRLAVAVRAELQSEETVAETLERYREVSAHRPGDRLACTLGSQRYEGRFVGFEEDGRLVIETGRGRQALSAADAVESMPASAER